MKGKKNFLLDSHSLSIPVLILRERSSIFNILYCLEEEETRQATKG